MVGAVVYPPEWETFEDHDSPQDYNWMRNWKCVVLDTSSEEYKHAVLQLDESMHQRVEAVRVERIQHRMLYSRYASSSCPDCNECADATAYVMVGTLFSILPCEPSTVRRHARTPMRSSYARCPAAFRVYTLFCHVPLPHLVLTRYAGCPQERTKGQSATTLQHRVRFFKLQPKRRDLRCVLHVGTSPGAAFKTRLESRM